MTMKTKKKKVRYMILKKSNTRKSYIHDKIPRSIVLSYMISEKPAVDPSQQPYSKHNIWLQVSGKAKPTYGYKEQGNFHSSHKMN